MYLCEYLPRLNTITVNLDFLDDIKSVSGVRVTGDELHITAKKEYIVHLPRNNDLELINLIKNKHTLQVTFRCQAKSDPNNFMSLLDSQLWSCKDLLKTPKDSNNRNIFAFVCSQCGHEVISTTQFKKFSDMPSELWTEMMDFWHCHKPDTEQSRQHTKDYNGNISPSLDSIVIGNYYFLVNKKQGMEVSSDGKVMCKCGESIGEKTVDALKIFKWNMTLKYGEVIETYPKYLYVYNVLLDKINLNATRKLVMNGCVIWIFNIGMDVTLDGFKVSRALKILYCKKEDERIYDDEVEVDSDLFECFLTQLDEVNDKIPQSARILQVKEDEKLIEYRISYLGIDI